MKVIYHMTEAWAEIEDDASMHESKWRNFFFY